MKRMLLETERLYLLSLEPDDAPALLDFFQRNRGYLEPWEPARGEEFYTLDHMKALIASDRRDITKGCAARLWLVEKKKPYTIIGSAGLTNIVMGPFCSCNLGYRLDKAHTGKGLMTEALETLIAFAFERVKLHRIEANIMPSNSPSLRLATRLGFTAEGISQKYLKINGVWEDHQRMVLLNEALE